MCQAFTSEFGRPHSPAKARQMAAQRFICLQVRVTAIVEPHADVNSPRRTKCVYHQSNPCRGRATNHPSNARPCHVQGTKCFEHGLRCDAHDLRLAVSRQHCRVSGPSTLRRFRKGAANLSPWSRTPGVTGACAAGSASGDFPKHEPVMVQKSSGPGFRPPAEFRGFIRPSSDLSYACNLTITGARS